MKKWSIVLMVIFMSGCLALLGVLAWRHDVRILLIALAILPGMFAFVWILVKMIRLHQLILRSIRLLTGKTSTNVRIEELPTIVDNTNLKFKLVSEHIKQLGDIANVSGVHASLVDDEVGQALLAVQVQMKSLKEDEDNQHWMAEGLAKFADVLRKKEALPEYSASIIASLVKYVGANQGGLFLQFENEEDGQYLELTGSYAYEKRRHLNKKVYLGEGLLGQCMFEKEVIFITDIPKNYIHITSGLGLATPRNIVVVPLLVGEVFYGAFELASFEILKAHQIEFLQKVAIMIAAEIGSIKTLDHTKALLDESDGLSRKLQAQEEEMRSNLEELTAAQEEMKRNHTQLVKKQAELDSYLSAIDNTIASAEFSLAGKLTAANNLFLTITGYSSQYITGKTYSQIFNNDQGLQVMWENIQLGKFFSGEFRMRDPNGNELWMNGTLNPILDSDGKPEKVMLFAQFTTQEKEKLNELGGMVQAIKQTLPWLECTSGFQCKSANDKFMKMFGLGRMELKNKSLDDFMANRKDTIGWKEELLTRNSNQLTLEFVVAGEIQKWEVSISVIHDLSGNISRVVMMLLYETENRIVRLAV